MQTPHPFPDPALLVEARVEDLLSRLTLSEKIAQMLYFTLQPRQMALVDEQGRRVVEPAGFEVWVGSGQPGRVVRGWQAPGVSGTFRVAGQPRVV